MSITQCTNRVATCDGWTDVRKHASQPASDQSGRRCEEGGESAADAQSASALERRVNPGALFPICTRNVPGGNQVGIKRRHSALVGIAIERLVPGVDAPIASYFPYLSGTAADARKKEITIADLLTMRSGLRSTSRWNYGAWVQSPYWVRYVLSRPFVSPPGEQLDYSTGNTHLLSAILTKASGRDTWAFAQEALANRLGFSLARWPQDPQGIYLGGNEMLMTPTASKQQAPEMFRIMGLSRQTRKRFDVH